MPIYEYHCKNCDQDFEYLVFGSEKPNCPGPLVDLSLKAIAVKLYPVPPGHPHVAVVRHPVAPAAVTSPR
jgi:putative FmdB family regulatory protein